MASAEDVICSDFGSCRFNESIIINTHSNLTGYLLYDSPCGIITTSDPGDPFTTSIHDGSKFYTPAFLGISRAVKFKDGETKTGAMLLSNMCSVREKATSPELETTSLDRSINASCKFTGYKPLSIVPNYQLFLPHCTALVREGIWKRDSNGKLTNVSRHFGLKLAQESYKYSKKRPRGDSNYFVKKTMLDEILSKQAELSTIEPSHPDYNSKKEKISIMSEAFKNYVFSIEPNECIPVPKYVLEDKYTGSNPLHPISLDKILNIAAESGHIGPKTVVIIMGCSVGIDRRTADIMKSRIATGPGVMRVGGDSNNKRKVRKYKIKKTKKPSRYIIRKKTRQTRKTRKIKMRKNKNNK
jgi:hypothetical protein